MITTTFTDFDEFRTTNPEIDGAWLINGGSEWGWRTDSVDAGDCHILRCYSNTGLIIEGSASNEGYGFYIPFKRGVWRNNGTPFHDDEFLIFEPGSDHYVTSKQDDGWHLFYVPKHMVEAPSHEPRRHSYTLRDPRARAVRDRVGSVLAAAVANPAIESTAAMRTVEAELLSLVLPLLEQGRDGDAGSVDGRERDDLTTTEIVHQARAALDRWDDINAMTPSLLARHVGVSERRLRAAFNEHYQIGPRSYLILRQLHEVRRNLLASRPDETTVTDTLTASGVWHFGRFATRYRSLFSESPSETLRRGSGVRAGSSR